MVFEVKIEENYDKNAYKSLFVFACVFYSILGGFWEGFGRCFGGLLGLFCVTWGYFFQFARTFLDFFLVWQRKLSKLTRCGGLEALKGVFYLAWKGRKFYSILSVKVDRRREWHAKFNQGVIGRSLVKSCNQGANGALTCGYNLMIFWVKKGIDVANGTQGTNGALTCIKFSPRFP